MYKSLLFIVLLIYLYETYMDSIKIMQINKYQNINMIQKY